MLVKKILDIMLLKQNNYYYKIQIVSNKLKNQKLRNKKKLKKNQKVDIF